MQDVSEFLKASHKCRMNRENWYADELLELVAHIQEHAKDKDISIIQYLKMLDGVIDRASRIQERIKESKMENLLKNTKLVEWGNYITLSDAEVKDSEKRSKLWSKLREQYPNDDEIKNLTLVDMSTKNEWFEKYNERLN